MKIEKFTQESLLFSVTRAAENIKRKLNISLKEENVNFYQAYIQRKKMILSQQTLSMF